MRIVLVHPVTHDTFPTNSCFFCGYPVHHVGIMCIDETARGKVRGLVCATCLEREPAQLQATLSEKAKWLWRQEATFRSQADRVRAQAEALERWAQQPVQMPAVDDLEFIPHVLDQVRV